MINNTNNSVSIATNPTAGLTGKRNRDDGSYSSDSGERDLEKRIKLTAAGAFTDQSAVTERTSKNKIGTHEGSITTSPTQLKGRNRKKNREENISHPSNDAGPDLEKRTKSQTTAVSTGQSGATGRTGLVKVSHKKTTNTSFGDLTKDVLEIIFSYLPREDLDSAQQVNMHWESVADNLNERFFVAFQRNFPEIYKVIVDSERIVGDWREEFVWVKRYALYFPAEFEEIIFTGKLPSNYEWFVIDFREAISKQIFPDFLINRNSQEDELLFSKLREAIVDKNPSLLSEIILKIKNKSKIDCEKDDTPLEVKFISLDVRFLSYLGRYLQPLDRPEDTRLICNQLWEWIQTINENPAYSKWDSLRDYRIPNALVWAIVTNQPVEIWEESIPSDNENVNYSEFFVLACRIENETVVKYLIDRRKTILRYPILEEICKQQKPAAARLLLEAGADATALVEGEADSTPLHWVSGYAHCDWIEDLDRPFYKTNIEIAQLLIDYGANVNAEDEEGMTPFLCACTAGHLDMVKLLEKNKANLQAKNKQGETGLHLACRGGHLDTAKLLIESKADVNAIDKERWTPLHLASEGGHRDTAKLLIESKADVNAIDNTGWAPLHQACLQGHLDTAKLLIEKGAGVDAITDAGETPLHCACRSGHLEIVKFLIERNASVELMDAKGKTAIYYVCGNGESDILEYLCQKFNENNPILWPPIREAILDALNNKYLTEMHPFLLSKILKDVLSMSVAQYSAIYKNQLETIYASVIQKYCMDDPDLLLFFAIITRQSSAEIERIIEKGAKLNGPNKYGITAFEAANKFQYVITRIPVPISPGPDVEVNQNQEEHDDIWELDSLGFLIPDEELPDFPLLDDNLPWS